MKKLILILFLFLFLISCGPKRMSCGPKRRCVDTTKEVDTLKNTRTYSFKKFASVS